MELDEIKAAWQAIDRRLERQNSLSLRVFREGKLKDARRALWPLQWAQGVQIAAGIFLMSLFGPYCVAHWGTPHLLLPGLAMHAYGLMLVIFAARTMFLIGMVDYAEPVLQLQRRIAEICLWRARVEQPLLALAGSFIWVPLTLVIFHSLGADLWVHAPKMVYWLAATGLICVGVVYGFVWGVRRFGTTRFQTTVESSFIGRSLRKAQRGLDEISQFETE